MFRPFESDTDLMTPEDKKSQELGRMHASSHFIDVACGRKPYGLNLQLCNNRKMGIDHLTKLGPHIDMCILPVVLNPDTKEYISYFSDYKVSCKKCIRKMKKLGL